MGSSLSCAPETANLRSARVRTPRSAIRLVLLVTLTAAALHVVGAVPASAWMVSYGDDLVSPNGSLSLTIAGHPTDLMNDITVRYDQTSPDSSAYTIVDRTGTLVSYPRACSNPD